jgi:zinc transport system substrate-binding protein
MGRLAQRSRVVRVAAGLLVLGLAGAACSRGADPAGSSSPGGAEKLTVAASFYPVAAATEAIGGDCVEVVDLTPPGVEPHDLELTPDDVEAIAVSDLVLYLGSGFQPSVEDAIGDAQGQTLDVLSPVQTGPPPAPEDGAGDGQTELVDPHVWLDPGSWAQAIPPMAQALTSLNPDANCDFAANAKAYVDELDALDTEFRSGLDDCTSDVIVTNHAAFGYLASAYGLTQYSISGLSPDAEPTPERLAQLKDVVQELGVTTIFSEALVSPDVAQTLAEEAGVGVAPLNTLEGLTPEEITAGEDYASVMRTNLETLRSALGCS